MKHENKKEVEIAVVDAVVATEAVAIVASKKNSKEDVVGGLPSLDVKRYI
jgi:hypothetical protein